jgi:hypothetical protein
MDFKQLNSNTYTLELEGLEVFIIIKPGKYTELVMLSIDNDSVIAYKKDETQEFYDRMFPAKFIEFDYKVSLPLT